MKAKTLFTTKTICRAAVIAALYAVLTWVSPLAFGAGGIFEVRPAEALCMLPLFYFEAIPGLYIGCMLANLMSGYGVYDIFLGSLATLVAGFGTFAVGRLFKNVWLKLAIGGLFPVLVNAFFIPVVIYLASGDAAYWVYFTSLLLSESVWVYALGIPFYFAIKSLIKKNIAVMMPVKIIKSK